MRKRLLYCRNDHSLCRVLKTVSVVLRAAALVSALADVLVEYNKFSISRSSSLF